MAVQFGSGPSYAAQCPKPFTPEGYRYWNESVDGALPQPLVDRAQALANDTSVALGSTESYPLPGVTPLLLIEAHPWLRDAAGNLTEGCFRATGIYLPTAAPGGAVQAPAEGGGTTSKLVGGLTIASLVVGLSLSVPQLFK